MDDEEALLSGRYEGLEADLRLELPPKRALTARAPDRPPRLPPSRIDTALLPPLPIPSPSTSAHGSDEYSPDPEVLAVSRGDRGDLSESYRRTDDELPTDLQSLLDTIAKASKTVTKDQWRERARERVIDQAFLRCLESAESDARLNEHISEEAKALYDNWKQQTRSVKERNHEKEKEIRSFLDSQVAERMEKLEQEKREKKSTSMGVLVTSDRSAAKTERLQISRALEEQISLKTQLKKQQKEDAVKKERNYLKQLSLEIDLHNAMERAAQLEKQKSLLEAWEREGHIRNLKKVESYGKHAVDEYIQGNLSDTTATLRFPGATIGKTLNNSIGYDPRKGKL